MHNLLAFLSPLALHLITDGAIQKMAEELFGSKKKKDDLKPAAELLFKLFRLTRLGIVLCQKFKLSGSPNNHGSG